MAVYFKFKSAKDFDSIPIEGHFITLGNLKERIFESKHLGSGTDFDLTISNAQTNEEYVDEAALIPKNTSVLIRRVPGRPRKPIVTAPEEPKLVESKVEDFPPVASAIGDSSANNFVNPEESEWDEFGNDLYAMPEGLPSQHSNPAMDMNPADDVDEDSKIKALIETPALDWSSQPQVGFGPGRGFGRGMGGRMMGGRGFGRGGLERKTPPAGYVCHRCKVPGHFIQHCPTNGDPNYDIKRVKPPTGIPKSMLMATPDGSYALPSGAVAILKPNEAAFEKEMEGLPTARPVNDIPSELRCPLCKEVMKDAVLTSKCCFNSFCDKCIRDFIISKSMCVCGATNVLADDLLPNKTLREAINRLMETTTSSTDNAGSMVQIQDMESARPVQHRVPSPTLSAASKDERKNLPAAEPSSEMKQFEATSEGKDANIMAEKKATKKVDPSDAPLQPANGKEPTSQESAPAPEEVQEKVAGELVKKKKKKKTRLPGNAADMQWRGFQDHGGENFGGMPPYNPYWTGGMPIGMDNYMGPFAGTVPFMGYAPGPFDVPPFGGIMPLDPFGAQSYMMPVVPPHRDLSEYGMSSMGMNQGPPMMSREEFEARKADARRKREMERRPERDHSRDRFPAREASSGADIQSSMKPKPRAMSQSASMDRSDRLDRSERIDRPDRHMSSPREPSREPRRHSSPPPRPPPSRAAEKRRPSDRETSSAAAAAAAAAEAEAAKGGGGGGGDKKHKPSVFSRISFPESGGGGGSGSGGGDSGGKKRKSSWSSEAAMNGQHHHQQREDKRPAAYEVESSEEEEDKHFKRRSSSRRDAAAVTAAEWEEDSGGGHRRSSRDHHHHHRSSSSSKRR